MISNESKNDPTRIPIAFDPRSRRMVGVARHGMVPFDVPFISQVTDNLWQGGCQQGLILPTHINYILSLYPWERYEIQHKVRSEVYVRMYDGPDQALDQIEDLAHMVNKWRERGQVLVHCQAGLNRSSVVVARALMLGGMAADEAIALLRAQRSPACLCNPSFESWLRSLE